MDNISKRISLIQEALNRKIALGTLCQQKGLHKDFVRHKVNVLKTKKRKTEEDEELLMWYKKYTNWYSTGKLDNTGTALDAVKQSRVEEVLPQFSSEDEEGFTKEEIEMIEYDASTDEDYEERSFGESLRENPNDYIIDYKTGAPLLNPVTGEPTPKITRYHYKIFIRDQEPLEGYFSREEMSKVYNLYSSIDGAGLTLRKVSREFPTLTFRDFKRILRAFSITKQSIPIAPHQIQESSPDKAMELLFLNKENHFLKQLDVERARYIDKQLKDALRENFKLKQAWRDMKSVASLVDASKIEPFHIVKKEIKNKRALLVYLSDQHVGAQTAEGNMYENEYNEEEFKRRMTKVAEKIQELSHTYKRFDKIIVCNVGDCLDGYNQMTTRGGHSLPQNLTNRGQYRVYIETMLEFFDTVHKLDVANEIEFYSVGDSNHAGDMEWIANHSLIAQLSLKYPDMGLRLFNEFIEHFSYGDNHTFIMTHGKDKEDMKHGFPLSINDKTQTVFTTYIVKHKITSSTINVIKGDLHQSSTQFGKLFRYKNIMSLYGQSKWIQTNFGDGPRGVDYEIVDKEVSSYEAIVEGRIYL